MKEFFNTFTFNQSTENRKTIQSFYILRSDLFFPVTGDSVKFLMMINIFDIENKSTIYNKIQACDFILSFRLIVVPCCGNFCLFVGCPDPIDD